MSEGVSRQTIFDTLIENNWDEQLVNEVFATITGPEQDVQSDVVLSSENADQSLAKNDDSVAVVETDTAKYGVLQAIKDSVVAIRNNIGGYLALAGIGLVVTGIMYVVLILIVINGMLAQAIIGNVSAGWMSLFLPVALGIITLITSTFISSFIMVTTSITVNDGAEKRKSNIGNVLRVGLKRFVRVALASFLMMIVVLSPLIIVPFLSLALFSNILSGSSVLSYLSGILVMLAGGVWFVVTFLKFALVPYVATFEPNLPLLKTLGRSNFLLKHGGQLFLAKGAALAFVVLVATSLLTGENLQEMQESGNLFTLLVSLVFSVISSAVLVMLYRNRTSLRDDAIASTTQSAQEI
ncbi:hypothetical protein B7Z28_00325 [Candidatus Saccharibacteria bacterium 32-45-3]|nr:MAG: hypothetical protein B7Z28_00325 [Candidatus Saccharibacteria bacterium 32-45-3]